MAFEKKVPQWNAQGVEPPESLKNSGFQPEYKPPADYFNWFWYNVAQCLMELQGMSPEDIGALPMSGGGTVAADNIRPIIVKNLADNACYTRFDGKDGILGFLGFAKEGYVRALTKDGSVLGDVYHTGNKPTPSDIGALALSGGVMTGQGFYLNNKTGRIVGNQNGMWLRTASSDVDNNEDARHLKLWNATYQTELARALYLFDTKTGKDYTIYGEHNREKMGVARIATGSYVGTGDGMVKISFDFVPKFVFVMASQDGVNYVEIVWISGMTKAVHLGCLTASINQRKETFSLSGNTLTISNAGYVDVSGETYHYVAFG